MTTAGEMSGEWLEDFNEKRNMLCNERERRREETQKRSEGRYTIRGSHDLLKKSRVQPVCHIYFPHTFMGELCFPINAHAEAQWSLNPSSMRYFTSFTVILSFSHFPYTHFSLFRAGWRLSQHALDQKGRESSQSVTQAYQHAHVHIHTHWQFRVL